LLGKPMAELAPVMKTDLRLVLVIKACGRDA